MSTRHGPYRIVALHCGKFDFAEVELDVPVHLIGANNVGKTSLISLLQFLYIDDQRHMHFSREMSETRKYYFPGKQSYALFECLTSTGFQVVGVRGLGPIRQHEYDRFVYTGRIDLSDFLDDQRNMREPEDSITRLANKGYKRLEPRQMRAALTGVGDARDVYLGLVPARHSSTYDRFRKVFGNILRLSHLRQDELKQLLLDIYGIELHQPEIDLAKHYKSGFEQVRRDSHDVQELKLLQGDIERLLRHLDCRDRAREVIPALWQAVGRAFTEKKAAFDQDESALQTEGRDIETHQADLKSKLTQSRDAERELTRQSAVLEKNIARIGEQRLRFQGFVTDWARQRQATVKARLEELVVRIRNAADEPVEQVIKRLRTAETQLTAKRDQFNNLAYAAVNYLRENLEDHEIAEAFTVLNPDLLKLPVNTEKPGITAQNNEGAATLIRALLAYRNGRYFEIHGIKVNLDAIAAPRLAEYQDPDQIKENMASLERDVRRYSETLEAAEQAEALRNEKSVLEEELARLIGEINDYKAFCDEEAKEAGWKDKLTEIYARQQTLTDQIAAYEHGLSELVEADQRNKHAQDELKRKRDAFQEQIRKLPAPPEAWPVMSIDDIPQELDDLTTRYRKAFTEEQSQAEQVKELLETIEKRTYARYTAADEAGTIQALRDQLDSIPQRELAVKEMWKGIAVGIKKDLQNIGRDLETLKGLVNGLNRQIASVSISNLASLTLLVEPWPKWVKLIQEITVEDELPLFSNPKATEQALEGIGLLLSQHPRVDLQDLFNLSFAVGTLDGKVHRHEHLDAIESNGTTVTIKVLVNLMLLRGLLGNADVQIPFYLDECSSLDQANLTAIVGTARQMGFIAVLASPEAMDAADKLYFIKEQPNGRVILDQRESLMKIQRDANASEKPANA